MKIGHFQKTLQKHPGFCCHAFVFTGISPFPRGTVFQSLWYILQLIWIGSSSTQYIYPIYFNHLLLRAWGLDILRFQLGGAFFRQWNIILGANTFRDIREECWMTGVIYPRLFLISIGSRFSLWSDAPWPLLHYESHWLFQLSSFPTSHPHDNITIEGNRRKDTCTIAPSPYGSTLSGHNYSPAADHTDCYFNSGAAVDNIRSGPIAYCGPLVDLSWIYHLMWT